jgi:hypothetical protein
MTPRPIWPLVLRVGPVFVSLLALGLLLAVARHGFDLTDEAASVTWISNPSIYPLSVSQYGFAYHPLHWLVGGDLALLRQLNMIVTMGLGCMLGLVLIRTSVDQDNQPGAGVQAAMCVPLGFVALLVLKNWIATPNYNSLNLQGLLVSTMALLLLGDRRSGTAGPIPLTAGAALLGVGGWLVFMAKPTSAALLVIVAGAHLLAVGGLRPRVVVIAATVAALFVLSTALLIDGSVARFIARLSRSAAIAAAMDGHYSVGAVVRFDRLSLEYVEWAALFVFAAATAAVVVLAESRNRLGHVVIAAGVIGLVVIGLVTLAGGRMFLLPSWTHWYAIQIVAVPLGTALALAWLAWRSGHRPSSGAIATFVLLLMLPYVHAIGSNMNYWTVAGVVAVFWAAAALQAQLAVARACAFAGPILSMVIAFAIAAYVIGVGLVYPYRQTQPIREQSQPVRIDGGVLRVAKDTASYVQRLRLLTVRYGFRDDTALIDLTGHYPGASVVLRGIAPGQAWLVGGYAGSNAAVAAVLRDTPCRQLAAAWLLFERNGPRALLPGVVGLTGTRYRRLGPISSPTGSYPRSYEHYLLQPMHDTGMVAERCQRERSAGY